MRLKEQAILLKKVSFLIQKHLKALLNDNGLASKALQNNHEALKKLADRDASDLNQAIPKQALLSDLITHCRMCDNILEICSLKRFLLQIDYPEFTQNHLGDILLTETAILRFLDKPYQDLLSDESSALIDIVEFTRSAAISWLRPIRLFVFFPDEGLKNIFAEKTPKDDIIHTLLKELHMAETYTFAADVLEKYTENELKFLKICNDFYETPLSIEKFIAELATLKQSEHIKKFMRFAQQIYSSHFAALHVCNPNNGSLHQLMTVLSHELIENTKAKQHYEMLFKTASQNGTLLKNPRDLKNPIGKEMLSKFFKLKLRVFILMHSEELNASPSQSDYSPTNGTSPTTHHYFL